MVSSLSPSRFAEGPSQLSMPQLFAALDNAERATVVTPNRRLATYIKDRFDDAQRASGKAAWVTPDILPMAMFLERCYQTSCLRFTGNDPATLLDAAQNQLLWEQVVDESDVAAHLLSGPQTAKQAAAAWTVANAWNLLSGMRNIPLAEDAETFLRWAKRFQQLCRDRNVIDSAVLASSMLAFMKEQPTEWLEILPKRLYVAGFDIVTAQQQHFLGECAAIGVSIQPVQLGESQAETQCSRVEFSTEKDELKGCALWARQRLQMHPAQRIAIVVPDLRGKRSDIARALTDALSPGFRGGLTAASGNPADGFNISLGCALGDYALVHDAIALIAFSQKHAMPIVEVSALLRSPFIAAAEIEIGPRATLDAALRKVLGVEISLFGLQRKLKLSSEAALNRAALGCPRLLKIIDRVASNEDSPAGTKSERNATSRKPSPRDWSRHFGQLLSAWGFPGDTPLSSADYQVLEKFRDALSQLSALELVQPRMRIDEAINHLRRIVADTVFQPEAAQDVAAPILVLGVLESAGQSFDALWVTGLSEDAWPLAVRPNPFIPALLQRAAGVPEASTDASLELDKRITQSWRHAAPEVIFSHARAASDNNAGDQARKASALIRDIEARELATLIETGEVTDLASALLAGGQLEPVPDKPLSPLSTPVKVAGGATILRDQAACAFRAFARHRLSARALEMPATGLDAADRGTLLHRVLSIVWTRLKTLIDLLALDEVATAALVSEVIGVAIEEARSKGLESLTGRFAEIEGARLKRLVIEWLNYERERAPFAVVACEQAHDVTLAGLSMRLRLDRLDRLQDGTHALIDYKTGNAKVADWLGPRMDEPQLPLYFQTSERAVTVLAFARVKRGIRGKVFGFEGVSVVDDLLPDVVPIEQKAGMEKKGYVSWDVLTAEWERSLHALATDFIDGANQVDPKNGTLTCAQCDLQSLCRISDLSRPGVTDESETVESAGGPVND